MQDVKSLIADRDKSNADYTLKIFKQIGPALGCITAYLRLHRPRYYNMGRCKYNGRHAYCNGDC